MGWRIDPSMMQLFGTKRCRDTQKALRFLKERRIEVQFRDIDLKPPSPGELEDMIRVLGDADLLIDACGKAAEKRGIPHLLHDVREELLRDPRLYRTPILRSGKNSVIVGADEKAWSRMALSVKDSP
jgi:arsenate reductase